MGDKKLIDNKTIERAVDALEKEYLGEEQKREKGQHEFYACVMPDTSPKQYDLGDFYIAVNLTTGTIGTPTVTNHPSKEVHFRTDSEDILAQILDVENVRQASPEAIQQALAEGIRTAYDYLEKYVQGKGLVFKRDEDHLRWAREG